MASAKKNQTTETTSAPAQRAGKNGVTQSGITFKKVKTVTVPVLKLSPDVPVYIRVEQAMEISKQIDNKKGQAMEPATIMHCTDLNSDEECLLIVGKMLQSVIDENFPDQSYVGKCFEVINHGKRGDKKYNAYSLNEIELDQ